MLGPILGFVDVPVLPAELTRKDYVDNGLAGKANAADLANYLPLAGGAVNGFTSFARSDTPDGGAVISVQSTAVDDGAKISFLDNVGIEVGSISISNSNDNTSVNSINDANLAGLSTSLRIDNGSSITPVLRADATRVAIGGTGVISDSFYFNLSTLLFSARGDIFAFAGTPEEIRMSDLVTNASKAGTETSVIAGGVSVVTFNTPFADANYSITCSTESGIEEPAPTWNGKTLNGFNLHNHGNVAENIDWVCTPHNDS